MRSELTPEQFRAVEAHFHAARALDGEARRAYLAGGCGGDPEIRALVESLLARDRERSWILAAAPERVGSYRVQATLGEGGMAVVYLAEQEAPVRRRVALKVIKLGMDTREVLSRFELERQALALMSHSGIARVFDSGITEDGRPYFVMELVEGVPITRYCDERRLALRERLALFVEVCRAVQHAHQKAIIHRDLKPSNILVAEEDGRPIPKVIDFGIAKAINQRGIERTLATEHGRLVGTPEYMSPEQAAMSEDIDTRTDIYSLGVLLYELLAGALPFERRLAREAGLAELLRVIVEEDSPRPSARLAQPDVDRHEVARLRSTHHAAHVRALRGDLDWITLKAIDKDRSRRYASAGELVADVHHHFRDEPVSANPPTVSYRLRKFLRKHRRPLAAAGIVIAALIAGLVTSVAMYLEAVGARKALSDQVVEVRRAVGDRDVALGEKERALGRSEGLRLSAQAAEILDADPGAALHLAIEGARRHDGARPRSTLLAALTRTVPCRVLEAHTGELYGVGIEPGGDRVLTWSQDGTARVWGMHTGSLLLILAHRSPVVTAAWSADGRRIATGAGRLASIWDAESGAELLLLRGHEDAITSVAFSPDSSRVVTGSRDATARVWSAESSELATVLAGHTDRVYRPSFSPDGSRVITASRDGTARVWNAATGAPLFVLSEHRGQVDTAIFGPDGLTMLTSSHDSTARVWEARTGSRRAVLAGHGAQILDARFSPDGRLVATASNDSTARIWDAAGRELFVLGGHALLVRSARFGPDGTQVLTFSDDRSLRVWSTETGALLRKIGGHGGVILDAAFSPDGRRIVSASVDGTARIWDLAAAAVPALISPKGSSLVGFAFAAGGDRALTALRDGAVVIWNAKADKRILALTGNAPLAGAAFDREGRVLARHSDGTVTLRDATSGDAILTLRGHQSAVLDAVLSADGSALWSVATDGTVREWGTGAGIETARHDLGAEGQGLRLASLGPEARVLLTLSRSHQARLWRRTGAGFQVMATPGAAAGVRHVVLSQDGSRALAVSRGGTALIVDTGVGAVTRELSDPSDGMVSGAFDPDGATAVTVSGDRSARVWDLASGAELAVLRGHVDRLRFAAFDSEGRLVVTASVDGSARLWEIATGREIMVMEHGSDLVRAEIAPDGRNVATIGSDGSVLIWPTDLLAVAAARVPRASPPEILERYEVGSPAERIERRHAWERERSESDIAVIESMIAADTANRSLHKLYAERFASLLKLWRDGARDDLLVQARRRIASHAESGRTNASELLGILSAALADDGRLREAVEALESALEFPLIPGALEDLLARCRERALPELPTYGSVDATVEALGAVSGDAGALERKRAVVDSFRSLVAGGRAGAGGEQRLHYLEARLLQRRRRHEDAAGVLEALAAVERSRPEPALRLSESLTALGRFADAEAALRGAISRGAPMARHRRLIEGWFETCIALGIDPGEIERRASALLESARLAEEEVGALPDVAWMLRTLGRQGVLRINCGGGGFEDSQGAAWSRDRCFTSGDGLWNRRFGARSPRPALPIEGTEDDDLYRDGRIFSAGARPPNGYRIPCPPGRYRVTMHFARLLPQPRSFDVLVEGRRLARGFDPGKAGAAAQRLGAEVDVADSFLDVEFVTSRTSAIVSAIEVETARAPPR